MSAPAPAERATDHLLRGSAFLMGAMLAASGVGFAFWLVAARLYTPSEIGIASTLISATTLIAYLSLLGLNNSLVRFLPMSDNRDAEVSQSVLITAGGGLLIATAYVLLAPVVALVKPGFVLAPHEGEVAAIFEVPLRFLMSGENHLRHSRQWQGKERYFYAMPYGERYIWGATAGMIMNLYDRLYRAP